MRISAIGLCLVVCVCLIVLPVAAVHGQCSGTIYFKPGSGSSGRWCGDNWNTTGCSAGPVWGLRPSEDDDVVICSGKTATIACTADADKICVDSSATLAIASTGVLELSPQGNETSTIDGTVELTGEIHLTFEDDACSTCGYEHVFTGAGTLVGESDSTGKILIEGKSETYPHALVNSMVMNGEFTVGTLGSSGVTRIIMDGGTFHANADGTLSLETDKVTDRGSTSLWRVSTNANAMLLIDLVGCQSNFALCNNPCLEHTEVEIAKGTYRTFAGVVTEGKLTEWPSGILDAREGERYNAPDCTCPTCSCDDDCDLSPPDCPS
jgi:hypothetical protein